MDTSYTKMHLGSPHQKITAKSLQRFFQQERDETLTLEFKSYDTKSDLDEVLRTVAAFLNSEGGLLVWGAPKAIKETNHLKTVKGNLTPIPNTVTSKDSIMNRILDSISYMPSGIQIEAVKITSNSYVYLIEVPSGVNKPYQYGKQYFVRMDGQSRPAPHYLVEALFHQVKYPELSVHLRFDRFIRLNRELGDRSINIVITTFVINSSKFIHEYDPYLYLKTDFGWFLNKGGKPRSYLFLNNFPSHKVLTYNLAIIDQQILHFERERYDKLCDENGTIKVMIVGGGRTSPPKQSVYELELTDAQNNKNLVLDDYISIQKIFNVKEVILNQFSHDHWEKSEEERIQDILQNGQVAN